MAQKKYWEPRSHWNNFTVPELKEILEHCVALERLGIAQDEKMMSSIERDIALREKKVKKRGEDYRSENKEQMPHQDYLLVPNV
jgi:hypothetical protein